MRERKNMIKKENKLSMRKQSDLLHVNRSSIYTKHVSQDNKLITKKISEIYSKNPVYGYRRITACLKRERCAVNSKRVLRLMQTMGLRAIYPGPKTTKSHQFHKKHPYILGDMEITRPHQAWQTDITYLRTHHGFIYMNALIDMHSRCIVGWSLSNTLDAESCLRTLDKALMQHQKPDVINSDQGVQYTCEDWVNALKDNDISISMSGRGRSIDNGHVERLWRTLKYEWIYLRDVRTVSDYKRILPEFVWWYNRERPHQALQYATPVEILEGSACGYVDKANALPTKSTGRATTKDSLNF